MNAVVERVTEWTKNFFLILKLTMHSTALCSRAQPKHSSHSVYVFGIENIPM